MRTLHQICLLRVGIFFIIAACALHGSPAVALTIDVHFDSGRSHAPSFDPDGGQLDLIMQAAASHWQDIVEDPGTLNIDFYWDDLGGEETWGMTDEVTIVGGKPTYARIRFDTQDAGADRQWYLDPQPSDHSEFDFGPSKTIRDLTPAEQAAWFNGSLPSLLEVEYIGYAPPFSLLLSKTDLLTTAMHEIGHALGMIGDLAADEAGGDHDYDFDPALVWQATMAAHVEGWDTVSGADEEHLAAHGTLMSSSGALGERRFPSATDVFAVAAASGWQTIDLPRKDFFAASGTRWNTAANWTGNRTPDSDDDAYIRHLGTATVDDDGQAKNLYVVGSSLRVNSGTLDIGADCHIGDQDAMTGLLEVNGGALIAQTIQVGLVGTGQLNLEGGEVIADELHLGANGTLAGTGGILRVNKVTGPPSNLLQVYNLESGHSGGAGSGSYSLGIGESVTVSRGLTVGYDAPATLTIASGAAVGNRDGYIGYNHGSAGVVRVDGAGSTWGNSYTL